MMRDEIIALLDARDPLAAAEGITPPRKIPWTRGICDDAEVLQYGAGTTNEGIADRLLALADDPSVRAVQLVPGDDSDERPGSWGVEDLLVTAVARRALGDHVAIRPDWQQLGASACQVAIAFGATEWVIPADDDADPDHLAAAIGAQAVAQ